MLRVICTQFRLCHLSVHVGYGSRRCEEIVKKSQIAPLNVIIVIIIVVVVIIMWFGWPGWFVAQNPLSVEGTHRICTCPGLAH